MDNIIKVRVPEYTKLCEAATECEAILRALGYGYVKVYGTRGSHTAEVYISEEERERFHRVLKENGYKWNQANKVIIKDGTEIIKI